MKQYLSINDISDLNQIIKEAVAIKKQPFIHKDLGKNKTIVLLFFNASLRTRLSTEKAANNLGMNVLTLNVTDAWNLEFEDGTKMDLQTSEHVKEAAQVLSQYADIIAVRAFPKLIDREQDAAEKVLSSFSKYASVPIVNMESATAHPLQALTDILTIEEQKEKEQLKVVLSWAPHPKALPQAVANSFIRMMQRADVEFSIAHPVGYELNSEIVKDTPVFYNQEEALKEADFIYVKNWSSYQNYGKVLSQDPNWMLTKEKLGNAKFMHCLPVRRNVVVEDAVLDSDQSLVIEQANNRTYAAQVVLKNILESL